MRGFEFFETTADIGIIARGKSLEKLFENAALGMFEVMCDTSLVEPEECFEAHVEGEDIPSLLFDWLTELLVLRDEHGVLLSHFKVQIKGERELRGKVHGEVINAEKHELKTEVKAVTYHRMEVSRNDAWKASFILDV